MKITMVEQITELTDDDKVLLISGDDIKQIDRNAIFDTARIATLEKRTEELKKYGADVKKGFADVISEKGVPTADTDSFETMQENVRKISDNTTGIVVYIDGDSVTFRTICKNVCSEDFYHEQQVSLYRSNNDIDAKNAELFYVKCKNAVVFGIANSYKADSNMVFIVMDAVDIRDDREYVIYACPATSLALCYINCDTNVRTDYNFSYGSTQDDFVMLIPWIIGSEYLMAKNAYAMRYGKWIAAMYYSFECNGKNYFVPNSVAASYRIALELID